MVRGRWCGDGAGRLVFIGRKVEVCGVEVSPSPGKVFLGFVAAARNKKMQWKGLSVNYYSIPFSKVLSDGPFQLHSSLT